MMKGMVCISFLVSLLLSSGCASSPVFKPEFMGADQQPNLERIRQAANSTSGIIPFVSKIYEEIIKEDEHSMEVDRVNSGSPVPHYDEFVQFMGIKRVSLPLRFHLNVFKEYCGSKNGTAYQWLVIPDRYAYYYLHGYSQEFITCEVNKEVIAGLIFVVSTGKKNPNLPYITDTTFVDATRFAGYMKRNRLFGYRSSNGIIMIPGNVLTEPNAKIQYRSIQYGYFLDYKNGGNTPKEVNILNSSVKLNNKEYAIEYKYLNEPIRWTSYSWGVKNEGVFVGEEGRRLTKLRFNPGQQLTGHVLFSIPGVDMMTENDLSSLVFILDGVKSQDFKKVTYYDQFKAPLKD